MPFLSFGITYPISLDFFLRARSLEFNLTEFIKPASIELYLSRKN